MKSIFTFVPDRVHYENFWEEIRKRNKWLINLRYLAVILLFSFIIGIEVVKKFVEGVQIQTLSISIIMLLILLYNFLFHRLWNKFGEISKKYNVHSLHFSLLQIIVDFIALMLLIYFTGGVESPFTTFYIFHIIIGSIILPGSIMCLLMAIVIILSLSGAILEYHSIIPHYQITGIVKYPLYNDSYYLGTFFVTFAIVVFISIYLANSIARKLYEREKELFYAYKDLEEAEKSKSKYVMTVVHDLKTPISAALTWVDLLADGSIEQLPESYKKPIERIQSRLKNAIDLIDNILKITNMKLTEEFFLKEEVDLVALCKEIHQSFSVMASSKNLDFKLDVGEQPVKISTNFNLLNLAISNLVSNAIKYTEPNGKVELIVNQLHNEVAISVADNGIGIPKKEIEKIFSEFYRTSLVKQKNIEGTGLGMALVNEAVKKLNGKINIFSPSYLASEGRPGTQVIIRIPLN
ncbi:MAG: HAMP domain-containing histidine kinase [Ignavibacteria bacterium]|nr:HAMP domain-containing histidine kinase [Ignavibacteria bacterium]